MENMFIGTEFRVLAAYLKLLQQPVDDATFSTHFRNAQKHIKDYKPYKLQRYLIPLLQGIKAKKAAAHLDAQEKMVDAAIKEQESI